MPDYNSTYRLCSELFGPVVGDITLITGDWQNRAAKELDHLVSEILADSKYLWSKNALGGMAGDDKKVIFDAGCRHDPKMIAHEDFHVRMQKRYCNFSVHSYILEESFAEAYTSIKFDSAALQEEAVINSEKCRKGFNQLLEHKTKQLEDIVKSNPSALKGYSEYPTLLFDLAYEAYVDLGIKFFRQYRIRKTVEELAVAEAMIAQTSDHRDGANYLNSNLKKDRQIGNILNIKSIYADIVLFFEVLTDNFCFDVYGIKADKNFYKGLIESTLKILVPGLQNESSLRVLPKAYSKLFKKE